MQIVSRKTCTLMLVAALAAAVSLAFVRDASAQYYPLPTPTPTPPRTIPIILSPPLMSPFPVVRIVGGLTRRGARIRLLTVRAPASAIISVRCFRRRCRTRSLARGRGFSRPVRFRRFERRFTAGTKIEVRVGRLDAIGKYTRFRIRRGRRPARRDLCLFPGATSGTPCPEP